MFRLSVLELAVACGLVILVIIVPLIVSRGYTRLNKRLNDIEDRFSKKK